MSIAFDKQAAAAFMHSAALTYAQALNALSDAIWETPETAFEEYQSAQAIAALLSAQGFDVETGIAGIETAFRGVWGADAPVIGLLGEYDALSNMNQQADIASEQAALPGANGHGCGHNLLGAGSLLAAFCLRDYLRAHAMPGTVVYYGCPGEEGGSGKAFMAREGLFRELDVALSWHPADVNGVFTGSSLANYRIDFLFTGKSAHAAACPHMGRSALDAVELMNVGVNYLREHVAPEARMHYALTDGGGLSPNVVQAHAASTYLLRAPKLFQVQEIYERVCDVARGAALMTGTQVKIRFVKACANILPSKALESRLHDSLTLLGPPTPTEQDAAFARALRETMPDTAMGSELVVHCDAMRDWLAPYASAPLCDFILPHMDDASVAPCSYDIGDVSHICPTGQVCAAAWAGGTPAHSWQAVAQGKSAYAHRAMHYAGKALALTAAELAACPEALAAAREEHTRRLGGYVYKSAIPPEIQCINRCHKPQAGASNK